MRKSQQRHYAELHFKWNVYADNKYLGHILERMSDNPNNPGERALLTARTHYEIPARAVLKVIRVKEDNQPLQAG